jgi:YfiH family protein
MADRRTDPKPPAWLWTERRDGAVVAFSGRDSGDTPGELLPWISGAPSAVSWLRQVHSNGVCAARPGPAGQGDALVSGQSDLGLAIATADCVPVLLRGSASIAAVHAGWRGLEAGVLAAGLDSLDSDQPPEAWIGPAIGPCCYEIGDEVVARLEAGAPVSAFSTGPHGRVHADLKAIARHQLGVAGVTEIRSIDLCTRCEPDLLQSYRRDGSRAGRNWAMIWLS